MKIYPLLFSWRWWGWVGCWVMVGENLNNTYGARDSWTSLQLVQPFVIKRPPQFGISNPLQWHHNGHNCISNYQPHHCLLNRLFRRRSKKTSKLRVTDLCAGNSPVTGEFPSQIASNVENVSIWWRYHAKISVLLKFHDPITSSDSYNNQS